MLVIVFYDIFNLAGLAQTRQATRTGRLAHPKPLTCQHIVLSAPPSLSLSPRHRQRGLQGKFNYKSANYQFIICIDFMVAIAHKPKTRGREGRAHTHGPRHVSPESRQGGRQDWNTIRHTIDRHGQRVHLDREMHTIHTACSYFRFLCPSRCT